MTTGLLLVHAFPLDAEMWEPQIAVLPGDAVVAAANLPGFGGAPGVGPVLSMRAAAERCLLEMDSAGLEAAVVCGLSMGGYVAFELWRRARGRVAGLVLANTRAGADTEEGAAGRRALADRLDAEGSGFLVESPPPLLSAGASEDLWGRVRASVAAQPAASIAAAARGMADRPDSTADLAGIDVPTLVIASTGDTLIPYDVTAAMAEQIPRAELVTLEGAGHLSNLEAPERFSEALQRHLDLVGLGG